jgi:hypothetical protein
MTSPSPDTVLEKLRQAAATCTACDLYKRATQTAFGEGNAKAAIVLLGEQPGHTPSSLLVRIHRRGTLFCSLSARIGCAHATAHELHGLSAFTQ